MKTKIEAMMAAALIAGGMLAGGTLPAAAHEGHHDMRSDLKPSAAADVTLEDLQLVNRDGKPVRFKTDAVGNRVVVIDFIYTNCTTLCPVTSALIADVQDRLAKKLGDRLGKDVQLITMTVDPVTDTPQRLKKYAKNFGTRQGWLWLTGDKPKIDKVLTGLGAYEADFTRHTSAIMVGDGRRGGWMRFYGLPKPAALVDRVETLLAARTVASAAGEK